jgi:hypothetical protein
MIGSLLALWLTLPQPRLTPGATRVLTTAQVCTIKWGIDARHVSLKKKKQILALYGLTWADHSRYIFDHLIPRQLAGADEIANIWPQPKAEAIIKDRPEKQLHRAVCKGTLSLAAAQAQMRTWGR